MDPDGNKIKVDLVTKNICYLYKKDSPFEILILMTQDHTSLNWFQGFHY